MSKGLYPSTHLLEETSMPRPSRFPSVLICSILVVTLLIPLAAHGENVEVKPVGVYAEIDTRLANEAVEALAGAEEAKRQATVAAIKAHPEKYAPYVFYVLSRVLFEDGDKDGAAFWFYAGQLRARFDANRCAERSARQAVAALNQQFGGPINQYTFQDIPKLEALIERVLAWDRETPHAYDHRWINLHGMGVFLAAQDPESATKPLSLPADEWDAIAETTRKDYLAGFRQAMGQTRATEE